MKRELIVLPEAYAYEHATIKSSGGMSKTDCNISIDSIRLNFNAVFDRKWHELKKWKKWNDELEIKEVKVKTHKESKSKQASEQVKGKSWTDLEFDWSVVTAVATNEKLLSYTEIFNNISNISIKLWMNEPHTHVKEFIL